MFCLCGLCRTDVKGCLFLSYFCSYNNDVVGY